MPISDTWERGNPYEQYIGRWSRRVAPAFVAWLNAPPGRVWVDVGCGTGALSAAILEHGAPAAVTGVEPSEGFRASAQRALGESARVLAGTADRMPLPDRSADVVVCALVLNFVPDVPAALAEMRRVLRPGGWLAGYVWDYAQRMELIRRFWDAAVQLDCDAAALDEGVRFPLCQPQALHAALAAAGLHDVASAAIDVPTVFADFDDYWLPFLGGQGPAPSYAMALPEPARVRLRERLRAGLPAAADGTIALTARAWAFRGIVAA